ncbi:hypothetical protein AgCh_037671 [Apium graveolens]
MNKMNNDSEKHDDTKMKMDQISRWPRPSILEKKSIGIGVRHKICFIRHIKELSIRVAVFSVGEASSVLSRRSLTAVSAKPLLFSVGEASSTQSRYYVTSHPTVTKEHMQEVSFFDRSTA